MSSKVKINITIGYVVNGHISLILEFRNCAKPAKSAQFGAVRAFRKIPRIPGNPLKIPRNPVYFFFQETVSF